MDSLPHPSRLVAVCLFVVSVLSLARFGIERSTELTALAILSLTGAVVLFCASLYGIVRYESNPIVTEYGPTTYVLCAGCLLWALGIAVQLLS